MGSDDHGYDDVPGNGVSDDEAVLGQQLSEAFRAEGATVEPAADARARLDARLRRAEESSANRGADQPDDTQGPASVVDDGSRGMQRPVARSRVRRWWIPASVAAAVAAVALATSAVVTGGFGAGGVGGGTQGAAGDADGSAPPPGSGSAPPANGVAVDLDWVAVPIACQGGAVNGVAAQQGTSVGASTTADPSLCPSDMPDLRLAFVDPTDLPRTAVHVQFRVDGEFLANAGAGGPGVLDRVGVSGGLHSGIPDGAHYLWGAVGPTVYRVAVSSGVSREFGATDAGSASYSGSITTGWTDLGHGWHGFAVALPASSVSASAVAFGADGSRLQVRTCDLATGAASTGPPTTTGPPATGAAPTAAGPSMPASDVSGGLSGTISPQTSASPPTTESVATDPRLARCATPTSRVVPAIYMHTEPFVPAGQTAPPNPLDNRTLYIADGPPGAGVLCLGSTKDGPPAIAVLTAPNGDTAIPYLSSAGTEGVWGATAPGVTRVELTITGRGGPVTLTFTVGNSNARLRLRDLGDGWHAFNTDTGFMQNPPPPVAAEAFDAEGNHLGGTGATP